MQVWVMLAMFMASVLADHPPPSNSYGVPHVPPGPYGSAHQHNHHHHHHHQPAPAPTLPPPSNSYGVPLVPAGPYAPAPTTTTTTTPAPAPAQSYGVPAVSVGPYAPAPRPTTPAPTPSPTYGAPSPSYGVPGVPTGPYGSGTRTVPGEYRTTSHAVAFYAPLFRNVYAPYAGPSIPAPSPGYGVPTPSNSYGVPVTPTGPYGGAGSYAPTWQRHKVGDALVRNWLTQTLLYGGGRVTEHRVPDAYGNYRVVTNEEWDDQVPNYHYGYDIDVPEGAEPAGADTSASETRNGGATQGRYSVKLPDGRTQIVQYTADDDGYKANVSYA